jgi:hypothetical protein
MERTTVSAPGDRGVVTTCEADHVMERHRPATRGGGFVPFVVKLGPRAVGDWGNTHELEPGVPPRCSAS